jgi:hypothetical protein
MSQVRDDRERGSDVQAHAPRDRRRESEPPAAVRPSEPGPLLSPWHRPLGWAVLIAAFLYFLLRAPGIDFYMNSSDHGFQLSVGTQILKGRVPGIDVLIAYGPMVMYTSAFGLWASGSLIGETLVCCAFYALTIFLLYHLVAVYTSKRQGVLAAVFGVLLQARFYKWYLWLIPLVVLWVWHRYANALPAHRFRWIACAGGLLGLCWLYRLDFGTTNLGASLLILAFVAYDERPFPLRRMLRSGAVLVASFAIVPLVWLAYLVIRVGPGAPWSYLSSTAEAMTAIVEGLSHPPPPFRSVIVAYWLIPGCYLASLCYGFLAGPSGGRDRRRRFLVASALVGMACLHQSLHRMDPGHLLQVIPPAIVCISLLVAELLAGLPGLGLSTRKSTAVRVAGACAGVLTLIVGVKLARWGETDLAPLSIWPNERYAGLANPLGPANHDPRAAILAAVTRMTGPDDAILAFPLDPQFYAITNRRLSGRLHAYYQGLFSWPRAIVGNLRAIEADMPRFVLVPSDFDVRPDQCVDPLVGEGRQSHHELEAFIRREYSQVVLKDGGLIVLGRGSGRASAPVAEARHHLIIDR